MSKYKCSWGATAAVIRRANLISVAACGRYIQKRAAAAQSPVTLLLSPGELEVLPAPVGQKVSHLPSTFLPGKSSPWQHTHEGQSLWPWWGKQLSRHGNWQGCNLSGQVVIGSKTESSLVPVTQIPRHGGLCPASRVRSVFTNWFLLDSCKVCILESHSSSSHSKPSYSSRIPEQCFCWALGPSPRSGRAPS